MNLELIRTYLYAVYAIDHAKNPDSQGINDSRLLASNLRTQLVGEGALPQLPPPGPGVGQPGVTGAIAA